MPIIGFAKIPQSMCSYYHSLKPSSILILYTILVLSQIRSEETLIMYLKKWDPTRDVLYRLHQFKDITLNFDLSVRMQSVLQRLSTTGGPLFPTVDVRHAASDTMDVLYPVRICSECNVERSLASLVYSLPLWVFASLLHPSVGHAAGKERVQSRMGPGSILHLHMDIDGADVL